MQRGHGGSSFHFICGIWEAGMAVRPTKAIAAFHPSFLPSLTLRRSLSCPRGLDPAPGSPGWGGTLGNRAEGKGGRLERHPVQPSALPLLPSMGLRPLQGPGGHLPCTAKPQDDLIGGVLVAPQPQGAGVRNPMWCPRRPLPHSTDSGTSPIWEQPVAGQVLPLRNPPAAPCPLDA